jgi:hypothetical protein
MKVGKRQSKMLSFVSVAVLGARKSRYLRERKMRDLEFIRIHLR